MPTKSPKTLPASDLLALRAAVEQLGEREVARLLGLSAGAVRGLLAGKSQRATVAFALDRMPRVQDKARIAGRTVL